jgi:hypothetical protein
MQHGTAIKITNAQQAKLYNNYKNTKLKLLKTNAAIWFNKMCRIKQLNPNYINIKINGRKPQDKKTTVNAIRYRINQEITSLHCKKQNLNQRPYHIHLENAQCNDMLLQHHTTDMLPQHHITDMLPQHHITDMLPQHHIT